MSRLLNMVALNIGNSPNIARALSKRVAGILSGFRTFEVFFAGIFLWHSHRIEIKHVVVALRKPNDRLVTTRKAFRAMQAVLEVPDNAISHSKAQFAEDRI